MTSEVRHEALRSGVEATASVSTSILGMKVVADPSMPPNAFELRTEKQSIRVFTEHYHCPCGCDHPQPFALADGRQYCGRCYATGQVFCLMELCTPKNCID